MWLFRARGPFGKAMSRRCPQRGRRAGPESSRTTSAEPQPGGLAFGVMEGPRHQEGCLLALPSTRSPCR